MDIEDTQR